MENIYRRQCKQFVEDDELFKKFKSVQPYRKIVGTDFNYHGQRCLQAIETDPEVMALMPKFQEHDEFGQEDRTEDIFVLGKRTSPTVLRYAHSVSLLRQNFGNLNGKNVMEIGVGWGELACFVHYMWPDVKYSMRDLPETVALAQKYLAHFGLPSVPANVANAKPDILIAEYSISEQDDDAIEKYWETYIKHAEGFLFRWNTFSDPRDHKWITKFREEFNIKLDLEHFRKFHNKIVIGKR